MVETSALIMLGTITLIVIIALVVIVIFYIIGIQRSLVNLDEMANNAMSQISVQLSTRWDAITALVKVTEKYSAHEANTLKEVIAQRKVGGNAVTAEQVNAQQDALSGVFSKLMAVAEQYPDLKADSLYLETMSGVRNYEENVRMSRMVYNDSVTKMNRMVRQFPSSLVADMLHFGLRTYLEENKNKTDYPRI